MRIGVPKEIKVHEYRVGLAPPAVRELVAHGHSVLVESGAGGGISAADDAYAAAGARIVTSAEAVFAEAEMIVKVKEPQAVERKRLRRGQVLFTYLHLAPDPEQTRDLLASGATCIAYETVTAPDGSLPLLRPMSEVAGRMSVQVGAHCLQRTAGGMGLLLSGVPGVEPASVVVLGGGVVGSHAAEIAVGMRANVTIIDRSTTALARLDAQFDGRARTVFATRDAIERHVLRADLVIGAVLIPGGAAPKLVAAELVKRMKPGSVLVDVAIDQGGCFETSHATTHADPTYVVDGVVHYCVANMPGAVPRTSTFALNHATLPFVLELADRGPREAMLANPHLLAGLNVHEGRVTNAPVAAALGLDHVAPREALGAQRQ